MSSFNAATWLVERHVDEGRGDRPAVTGPGGDRTYAELAGDLWAAGHGLADAGAQAGDRVVMVVNDEPAFPAFFLGAMRRGMVAVPVSTMLTPGEVATIAADCQATALVLSAPYLGHLPAVLATTPSIKAVFVCGGLVPGADAAGEAPASRLPDAGLGVEVRAWEGCADRSRPSPSACPDTEAATPAFWLYTSGTTGTPKGAIHRHGSLRATAETYGRTVLQAGPEDRFYSVAKLFFAFGLGNALTFPFAVGGTAILDPARPTPETVAANAEAYRPSLFFAPPGFCAALVDSDVDGGCLSTARFGVTAGETLPADLWRRFRDRFGVEILDGIGTTEALHIFCSNHPGDIRPGSTGRPVDGYECKLLDEEGVEVTAPDTPGFLHVRGESIASGYWQRPEATAMAFVDGWLRTGDVYSRDTDGYFHYFGRNNDLIKPGGIWVSPAEVEAALLAHDDVLEAAVVGQRDQDGLEISVAFVVPRAGRTIDADALLAHCRAQMAAFKRPRRIVAVDGLPKTATGKVRRFALREQLAAGGVMEPPTPPVPAPGG